MPRATVMAQMMVATAVTVKYAIVLSFLVLWLLNKVCRIAAGLLNILFLKPVGFRQRLVLTLR